MLAEVIFTPNEPRERNGDRFIDIKVELATGEKVNIYGQENTDDWRALQSVDKGQIIEVESFEIEHKSGTFWRLTDNEIRRVVSGSKHPANFEDKQTMEEIEQQLTASMRRIADDLGVEEQPNIETVQKLAVSAFMRYHKQ